LTKKLEWILKENELHIIQLLIEEISVDMTIYERFKPIQI